MTVIKVVKNQIFKKVYLPLKPTWRSCFFLFHSHDQKPKQNHQISSSRAKTRSTRSQTCVKYKANIICIKRSTEVKTGNLKILHKKMSKLSGFSRRYAQFLQNFMWFAFNLMHDWRAMTVMVHLAPWSKGQSSAMTFVFMQYSFCNSFRHGLICHPDIEEDQTKPVCFMRKKISFIKTN